MVSFDATILIQLINFLILLAILNQVFFKPIIKIQQERQAFLDTNRRETEQKHAELKTLREDYHQKLDAARQSAYDKVAQEVEQANAECEAQLQAVQAEMEARFSEARTQLSQQEAELRTALQQEVQPLVSLVMGQLLNGKASAKKEVNA